MNDTDIVRREELEEVISNLHSVIAAFSAVGAVLLALVVVLLVILVFVITKLQTHERSINALEDKESHAFRNIAFDDVERSKVCTEVQVRTLPNGAPRPQTSSRTEGRNARMTILIDKETVNVYGNMPQLGQTMGLAQDYFKAKTNTSVDIPAESMQVLDKDTNRRVAHSTIFTDDWRNGGVPTSILFNGDARNFQDAVTVNKGVFIHNTIGPEGGTMTISGVELLVPKGAIKQPTLLSIGLLWDQNYLPKLTKKQTILSPIVLCQPSGIKFEVPVTLSFPHAALNITQDWSVKILKREGGLPENTDWSQISISDYAERNIQADRISLDLLHFTLYTCIGESNSGKVAVKGIQVVAFAGGLRLGDYFKPRIYCLNDYKHEIQDVKMLESDIAADSVVRETSTLLVHDNGEDVMVELVHLLEGWKVLGERLETVPFEQVWHALHPHCSFILEREKTTIEIRCEFNAYQNGRENFAANLKLAEKNTSSKIALQEDDPFIELVNELVILLDPENLTGSDAGNWKDLAERMGCGLARIRWLKMQESPTKLLCRKWIEEEKKSLADLEQLLRDINRPDAADEVRKRSRVSGPVMTKV